MEVWVNVIKLDTYAWISFDFKMIITQVTLHSKLVNRCSVVHPNLGLLSIVSDPHPNVVVAAIAPDVVRHLKTDDQDPHVKLPGSFT